MNGIEIGNVEFHDDGTNLIVNVQVRNTSNRTLHVYASPRGIRYDPATRVLTVLLTDRELGKNLVGGSFVMPRFTTVDPNGQAVLTLKLPRFLTRLTGASSGGGANFERLAIHEATAVEVEVSWSDKPFYADPRQKKLSAREQLVKWGKDVARGRGHRRADSPASAGAGAK